ncbi:DNA cytosine methyltransferase [Microbacterium hominis]|uniref:Cytosine-specific methyltransferase n=1 Tax=Microbacterium hominis TaxID=162426 RepID=A0A0B4CU52_9MICO|nr:DNA cytosine methyltransferase [Microbacterium hominis]KIC59977.1 DNA methyltransferase [Microbacterium hominis]
MVAEPIRVLDLFAGAGGLTAGFHQADPRMTTVAAVELDPAAAGSFEATFGPGIVYNGSVSEWLSHAEMPPQVDIVVGGPPCQGFSTLGKRDEEDERNRLWRDYARVLLRVKPKYFVVENVSAFAKSSQYQLFVEATGPEGFLRDYAFEHRVLNAADYGAAQLRRRAVLIGYHRDLEFPGFPAPTHSALPASGLPAHKTVADVLGRVPKNPDRDHVSGTREFEFGGRVLNGSYSTRDLHWSRSYSPLSLARFAAIPAGGNRHDLPAELLARCWVDHKSGSGDVMGRLHRNRPSVTIRTEFFKPEKGRYLHPTLDRAITHYEAARLQGFTRGHRFVGSKTAIARQIGNAVPIPLGKAIASHLAESFR